MVKSSARAGFFEARRDPPGTGGGGGTGGGTGSDTTPPALGGPFYAPTNPWRTPIPSDWFNYVHPDTPSMVQGVYLGTDFSSMDIHAFAYRTQEMTQKGLPASDAQWAGPGHNENIVYVPSSQPMITVYVDWNPINKVYQFRYTSFQVPLPFGWTGYNTPNAGTGYFERRSSVLVNNTSGDHWIVYQPTPPGDPIRYLGTQTDSFWHSTHVEKVQFGWKSGIAPYWVGGGSGNPFLAGTITPYDILNTPAGGHYNHALALNAAWAADGSLSSHPKFAYPSPFIAHGGIHPATDGKTKTTVGIPHGARIFLDPTLTDTDLRNLGVTKEWQLQICRTFQKYGGISKESSTGQRGAGGLITEGLRSISWNIAQGFYPAGFQYPWVADGSMDNADPLDSTAYNAALPPALLPTSGSHWKVFDWNKSYPGITVAP